MVNGKEGTGPAGKGQLAIGILKAGAVAAIAGGCLRIAAVFIPYAPQSVGLETLYAVIDLCLLFGLSAIFWRCADRLGWVSATGYLLASAGLASIVGPDPQMFGLEFYLVGSGVFEIGLLVLAIAMVRRRQLRLAAWLWIVSAIASLAIPAGGGELAYGLAGLSLGLGFAWAGTRTYAGIMSSSVASPMAFNQVTIGCIDLEHSIAFYEALGFRIIVLSQDNGYARFEAPNETTLSLHQGLAVPAGAVLYFEHSNLDHWVDQLTESGLTITQAPADQSWGWREARLCDPAGNPICLFSAGEYRRFPPWRVVGAPLRAAPPVSCA